MKRTSTRRSARDSSGGTKETVAAAASVTESMLSSLTSEPPVSSLFSFSSFTTSKHDEHDDRRDTLVAPGKGNVLAAFISMQNSTIPTGEFDVSVYVKAEEEKKTKASEDKLFALPADPVASSAAPPEANSAAGVAVASLATTPATLGMSTTKGKASVRSIRTRQSWSAPRPPAFNKPSLSSEPLLGASESPESGKDSTDAGPATRICAKGPGQHTRSFSGPSSSLMSTTVASKGKSRRSLSIPSNNENAENVAQDEVSARKRRKSCLVTSFSSDRGTLALSSSVPPSPSAAAGVSVASLPLPSSMSLLLSPTAVTASKLFSPRKRPALATLSRGTDAAAIANEASCGANIATLTEKNVAEKEVLLDSTSSECLSAGSDQKDQKATRRTTTRARRSLSSLSSMGTTSASSSAASSSASLPRKRSGYPMGSTAEKINEETTEELKLCNSLSPSPLPSDSATEVCTTLARADGKANGDDAATVRTDVSADHSNSSSLAPSSSSFLPSSSSPSSSSASLPASTASWSAQKNTSCDWFSLHAETVNEAKTPVPSKLAASGTNGKASTFMLPSGNASGKKIQKRVSLSMTCFGNNLNDEDEPRCVTPTNIVAASVTPKMSRSVLGYSLTPKGTSSFALTAGNVVNVQSQQQQQPQQQKYEEDVLALKQTIDKLRRDSTVEVLQLNAAARQQEGLHKDYKEKVERELQDCKVQLEQQEAAVAAMEEKHKEKVAALQFLVAELEAKVALHMRAPQEEPQGHNALREGVASLEIQLSQLRAELATQKVYAAAIEQENVRLFSEYQESAGALSKMQLELLQMKSCLDHQQRENEQLRQALQVSKQKEVELSCIFKEELQMRYEQFRKDLEEEKQEVSQLQQIVESLKESEREALQRADARESQLRLMEQEVRQLYERIRLEELVRKRLHNDLMDLKGNIRVFCRIRPSLKHTQTSANTAKKGPVEFIAFKDTTTALPVDILEINSEKESIYGKQESTKSTFKFDRVFPISASQGQLFDELSPLVTSAMDGYNVTVFAYGQTGSGKTFTMMGPEHLFGQENAQATEISLKVHEDRGMIPRAINQVFADMEHMGEDGWTFQLKVSFLEIYNEQIRDLLESASTSVSVSASSSSTSNVHTTECKIMLSKEGKAFVSNLNSFNVASPGQIFEVIAIANANRSTGKTACNSRSSRSHSVFQLHIEGENLAQGKKTVSCLNLVDLAGSERLDSSKVQGQLLKETQAINASLSALSGCIDAIAQRKDHIPYRGSKLTHLLSDSLGGSAKTAFFVNLSPDAEHVNESMCTLRFAEALKKVGNGPAKKK